MASKLEKAVEIYRILGYEEADFKDISELGIGSREEQKIAREGLKSGEWTVIKEISKNSYGIVPVVDADLEKLAIFAIRVGVDAKRGAQVLRRGSEAALRAVMARGESYALNFIKAACTSNRRIWEHSLSVLGMLAINLVHQMNLEIPESVEYIKDWAAGGAMILGITGKERGFDEDFALKKEEFLRRFSEHIEVGISLNVPATGPFSKVLLWGVENHLVSEETAREQVFYALGIAGRPGDRKEWINVLEEIGLKDEDILSRCETLIPLLGLGESPLLERFAPVMIEKISDDLLYPLLISCTSSKVKKTKKIILNAVLKRDKPESPKDYEEWILHFKGKEDKSIAKLAGNIEKAWGLKLESEEIKEDVQGLWRESPKLWELPKFEIGEISSEKLTDLAAVVAGRGECVADIIFERFIAMANHIAFQNPAMAKMSLAGITNNDSSGIWVLGRWAKDLERNINPDRKRKVWDGEKEVLHIDYGELLYVRRIVLFDNLEKWPCLLSTPSYVDLSISLFDLIERLFVYEKEGLAYVSESDLQLALTRLDMEMPRAEDIKNALKRLKDLDLKILLPSGELLIDESGKELSAGEIIAGYLKDPYIEPEFVPGATSYWDIELDMPKSLQALPKRFSYSRNTLFSVFPTWGDYALTAVHRGFEVYHGQGIILRQVARRRKPVTRGALMNWIAIAGNLSDENAEDVLKATQAAWDRGLLLSGRADVSYLDWHGKTPTNLASLAASLEYLAKEGLLGILWEAACDMVEVSLKAPRMLSGTADIVKFLRNYLEEVIFAVKNNLVSKNVLEMKAVKTLAKKSGSSKAVEYAKEIVKRLKDLDIEIPKGKKEGENFGAEKGEEASKLSKMESEENILKLLYPKQDFENLWASLPESKALIIDHVKMDIKSVELRKKEKAFRFSLILPEEPEHIYQVTLAGWLYGLRNEGQVYGFRANARGEIINEEEKALWLHYDSAKKRIEVSRFRNWRGEEDSPLQGESAPYSKVFLTIAVALLAQDGESLYGAKSLIKDLVKSGDLNVDAMRNITRELLLQKDVSPAKLVRVLEKERELISVFWVMLIECIRQAGRSTSESNKPPIWVNRVLDICIYYTDYLREAAKRGYISGSDATWSGLLEIANCKAKSAAVEKAKTLAKLLGIRAEEKEN